MSTKEEEDVLLEEDDSALLLRGPEDQAAAGLNDQHAGRTLKETASLACKRIDIGKCIVFT
jgi:hypothetical protein